MKSLTKSILSGLAAIVICLSVKDSNAEILRVPSQYVTIQDAIDRSADNDTVLVAPGKYGSFSINTHYKTIIEWGDKINAPKDYKIAIISENGKNDTIIERIEGSNKDGICVSNIQSLIQGFTIQNYQTGIEFFTDNGNHVVKDCIITKCHTGIEQKYWLSDGTFNISNNTFFENFEGICGIDGIFDNQFYSNNTGIVKSKNILRNDIKDNSMGINNSNVVTNNRISGNEYGIMNCRDIEYNIITNNDTGIIGDERIRNNVIIDNDLGIGYMNDGEQVINNIIAFNRVGYQGDNSKASCNILYGNKMGNCSGDNCIENINEIYEDPLFCDYDNLDLSVSINSPALKNINCGLIGSIGAGCEESCEKSKDFDTIKSRYN